MMENVIYDSFKAKIMGPINLESDIIKVILVDSNYNPSAETHTQYSQVSNTEIDETGYTAGGKTLTNCSLTLDGNSRRGVFDADDVTWTDANISARGAIIYKYIDDDGSPDDTSPLICYIDFDDEKTSSNANFTIRWSDDGILYLQEP